MIAGCRVILPVNQPLRMRLRAPTIRPSVRRNRVTSVKNGDAMKHSASRLLVASLGGLALILASSETFSTSDAAQVPTVAARSGVARAAFARSIAHHHRGRNAAYVYWPDGTYGDYGAYGAVPAEPGVEVAPPSGDVHYTYTYDAPWDAVHRLPPNVVPGPRPYVSDCTTQVVTVPRRGDSGQTANINVTRCY